MVICLVWLRLYVWFGYGYMFGLVTVIFVVVATVICLGWLRLYFQYGYGCVCMLIALSLFAMVAVIFSVVVLVRCGCGYVFCSSFGSVLLLLYVRL